MSLLREIQRDAASSDVRVADLLRKCKLLAARLNSQMVTQWVDCELSGYPREGEIPEYRMVNRPICYGNFYGGFHSATHVPIYPQLLPPALAKAIEQKRIIEPISVCEDLAVTAKSSLKSPWTPNWIAHVGENAYDGMQCIEAWFEFPVGVFIKIVDAVKNRVLTFALEIERQNPDAGEAVLGTHPIPEGKVTQIFNNTVHGSVGNIASGSHDFSQQADVTDNRDFSVDFKQLALELPQLREAMAQEATEPEHYDSIKAVREAEKAIENKEPSKVKGFLQKAGKWALDTSTSIGTTVAADAIKKSMGLP
jgi:hypothetical protein